MQITLEAARVNAKLTQAEAAKGIRVSKTTIFNWEKGYTSPKSSQLKLLCELYKIPIDYIFLPDHLLRVDE